MALRQKIAVLIGGVGGAKLALGLANLQPTPQLTFIVNTGDDFWHLGLKICPDIDTLMYTLAGVVDPQLGWGIADDTTCVLAGLRRRYAIDTWFKLGDQDLALHLLRTEAMRGEVSLTDFTSAIARRLGITATILPMCEAEMPTTIHTRDHGEMSFQEYFVRRRWQPVIQRVRYGSRQAASVPAPVREALAKADLVMIAPSNPWLSIAPILAVPGMRELLAAASAPKVAITPVIGGDAVKGPTAKIMRELGLAVSARTVASYYDGVIDGFVDDLRNPHFSMDGLRTTRLDTLMTDLERKVAVAQDTLDWARGWVS
ncbi:MAG: 2-phospho-L-lactate transferase [Chloroflexi bacterium]|nr:2-phospho-L-lactate transferase [Chloroflexota bacterium]